MRRGIRSFCHGVGSTSTMQRLVGGGGGDVDGDASSFLTVPSTSVVGSSSCGGVDESEAVSTRGGGGEPAVTLEQMILQLDLEEEAARKARRRAENEAAGCCGQQQPRRASCANSSDRVLRSARDALSQYPRFSLDGRDAMYRASFSDYYDGMGLASAVAPRIGAGGGLRHGGQMRASVCCADGGGAGHFGARACGAEGYEMDLERTLRMPAMVAGESVVWCKPGVVAKLMGLEAVPVPVRGGRRGGARRKSSGPPPAAGQIGGAGGIKRRLMRRTGMEELEKERLFMALHGYDVAG